MTGPNPAYVREELTVRLAAALNETERKAKAATQGPWGWREDHGRDYADEAWSSVRVVSHGNVMVAEATGNTLIPERESDDPQADAAHIATWSPTDVLRHVGIARDTMEYALSLRTLGGTPASIGNAILTAEALRWGVTP